MSLSVVTRHELAAHLRSPRFLVLGVLALLLMPLSAYVGALNYEYRQVHYQELRRITDYPPELGRPDWGWRNAKPNDPALRAVRTPVPLSTLAAGHEATMPAYWQFGPAGYSEGPPAVRYDGLAGFMGEVDIVFVVQVLIGLLVVLLAFDRVSGEREQGTLRVLLVQPVPRWVVLMAKYLAILFAAFLPLVGGMLACILVLRLMGVPLDSPAPGGAIGWLFLASVLYLSTLAALGLLLSTATRQARTSLLALLICWVVFVLVVPRSSMLLASALRPVEPLEVLHSGMASRIQDIHLEWQEDLSHLLQVHDMVQDIDVLQGSVDPEYARQARQIDLESFQARRRLVDRRMGGRDEQLRQQRLLAGAVGALSPAAVMGFMAAEAAGTGEGGRSAWLEAVERHQQVLEEEIFDRSFGVFVMLRDMHTWISPRREEVQVPTYRELPPFSPPSPATGLWGLVLAAALLALYNLAFLRGACLLFQRYDPR